MQLSFYNAILLDYQTLKNKIISLDKKIDVLGVGVFQIMQAATFLIKKESTSRTEISGEIKRDSSSESSLNLVNRSLIFTFQLVQKQYPTELEFFQTFKRFRGDVSKTELREWWEFHREKIWKYVLSSIQFKVTFFSTGVSETSGLRQFEVYLTHLPASRSQSLQQSPAEQVKLECTLGEYQTQRRGSAFCVVRKRGSFIRPFLQDVRGW
jgi:hypothetical protein